MKNLLLALGLAACHPEDNTYTYKGPTKGPEDYTSVSRPLRPPLPTDDSSLEQGRASTNAQLKAACEAEWLGNEIDVDYAISIMGCTVQDLTVTVGTGYKLVCPDKTLELIRRSDEGIYVVSCKID